MGACEAKGVVRADTAWLFKEGSMQVIKSVLLGKLVQPRE